MGVVATTFIMKLQGTILVLAVLICQLQCAPKGCRGCEWDNTGHSNGHTTGQSAGKRSGDQEGSPEDTDALLPQNWWESKEPLGDGAINVKRSDDQDGSPEDTDALLPQNWWESKESMGDGAVNVKRSGAEPRGCRGCEWDDTENQPPNDQEKTKRDTYPADTGAIVPTGPSNGQEGDGVINVKRSDDGKPEDTDALLTQNWWESKEPMGDGTVNVKRSGDEPRGHTNGHSNGHNTGKRSGDKEGSPEDTDALLPQNWWESKESMGDGAFNVKRSGAEPRGCRGCE